MAFKLNPFTGQFDVVLDLPRKAFSASNNISVAADVTGLDVSGFKGGQIELTVEIDATADLYEKFTLDFINKSSSFEMGASTIGDLSNVEFSITSAGQIKYTSGNETGFVSSTFTWSIQEVK